MQTFRSSFVHGLKHKEEQPRKLTFQVCADAIRVDDTLNTQEKVLETQ
jgi:hypothetical protein